MAALASLPLPKLTWAPSLLVCMVGCAACGGGTTAPSTQMAAPPPRTTFTLDTAADTFEFSQPLGQLAAGQTFNLSMTVVQLNRADTENFAHAVDFWLSPAGADRPSSTNATSIGFAWSAGTTWAVGYRTPQSGFVYSNVRPTIPIGAQRPVRIARALDGSVQLWLDGINLWSVPDADAAPTVFVQAIGLRVDVAY